MEWLRTFIFKRSIVAETSVVTIECVMLLCDAVVVNFWHIQFYCYIYVYAMLLFRNQYCVVTQSALARTWCIWHSRELVVH